MPYRWTLTTPLATSGLARLLRGRIEDGTYPLGSLLPSATRLAERHMVSKATARHALEVLAAGLILSLGDEGFRGDRTPEKKEMGHFVARCLG
jgi:DNA-binding transcriptional regulator YhcF (GntR family)